MVFPRPNGSDIDDLGNKIGLGHPEWHGLFRSQRHEYVEHDLMDSLVALNEISLYIMYEVEPRGGILQIVFSNLQSQISHLYCRLDESGLSKIISKHESLDFLKHFSYSSATLFRDSEKELLERVYIIIKSYNKNIKKLQIPEEVWNKFWGTVDRNKGAMVTKMFPGQDFIHDDVYHDLEAALRDASHYFTLGQLPPLPQYRWSNELCISIGGILSISGILYAIKQELEPSSLGFILASIMAGIVGSSRPTGMV